MFDFLFIIIYIPFCFLSVRLFVKKHTRKEYPLEVILTVIGLTPFLGIPLVKYLFDRDY